MVMRKVTVCLLAVLGICGVALSAEVPRKAPEFEIHMVDGTNVPVSQFRDKVCALVFISTTCPHCQHYVQILNAIQKEYGPRGVQVLAAAFNEGARALLPSFIQQFQPAFPLGWSDHITVTGFLQISIMNPGFVPKLVLIDRGGTIRKQVEGQDDFFRDPEKNTRLALDEMLKAPMARKAGIRTAAKQRN